MDYFLFWRNLVAILNLTAFQGEGSQGDKRNKIPEICAILFASPRACRLSGTSRQSKSHLVSYNAKLHPTLAVNLYTHSSVAACSIVETSPAIVGLIVLRVCFCFVVRLPLCPR